MQDWSNRSIRASKRGGSGTLSHAQSAVKGGATRLCPSSTSRLVSCSQSVCLDVPYKKKTPMPTAALIAYERLFPPSLSDIMVHSIETADSIHHSIQLPCLAMPCNFPSSSDIIYAIVPVLTTRLPATFNPSHVLEFTRPVPFHVSRPISA